MTEKKVYAAINAVAAALGKEGIAKTRKNQQQGFMFRGIDEIYKALAPLLAEHKLCILPRLKSRSCDARMTKSGSAMYSVDVLMEFDFVSAEDGSVHTCAMAGEAMDSGDKATNKAMSGAFKYLCLQAFCIPLEGEDNEVDAHTPESTVPGVVGTSRDRSEMGERRKVPVPDPEFKKTLEEAAKQGIEAYRLAWEGGTVPQRTSCAALHEGFKVFAKAVDEKKA